MKKILLELPKRKRTIFSDVDAALVVRLYSDGRVEAVDTGAQVAITRDFSSFNVVFGRQDFSAGEPIPGLADLFVVDDISRDDVTSSTYGISLAHSLSDIEAAWGNYVRRQQADWKDMNQRMADSLDRTIKSMKSR